MAEPTLGELTYNPNPVTAEGDRVVVADNSRGIQDIIGAAQQKAQFDFKKQEIFNDRLSDALKNFRVDYTNINPNHADDLRNMAGGFLATLSKNVGSLGNPAKDIEGYNSIINEYDKLQQAIAQSKKQQFVAEKKESLLYDNPDWLTDENKEIAKLNYKDPLGKFTPRDFRVPDVVDLYGIGKEINSLVERQDEVTEPIYRDENGKPIYTGQIMKGIETSYDQPEFVNMSRTVYASNRLVGKYNVPIQKQVSGLYSKLSEPYREYYEKQAEKKSKELGRTVTPQEEFAVQGMSQAYNTSRKRTGVTTVKDESFESNLAKARFALEQGQLAARWADVATSRMRAKKEDKAKKEDIIEKPAILFGEHIDRLKRKFNKDSTTESISIGYESTDPKTRLATGIRQGDVITYRRDGSYEIEGKGDDINDQTIKRKSIGTIDNLAQGFIDATKSLDFNSESQKDASMSEGFQTRSETKFKQLYGTVSGKEIWDNWGGSKPQQVPTTPTPAKSGGMSDAEFADFLNKNGLKK